jgi:Icc protein
MTAEPQPAAHPAIHERRTEQVTAPRPSSTKTRILHVSDLHFEPRGLEQYAGLFDRLWRIRHELVALEPDVVVVTGDLTNRGSSTPEHFLLVRAWLEGLGAPCVVVPGNHDLGANRGRGEEFPDLECYEDVEFAETGYAREFGGHTISQVTAGDLTILGLALREDDPDGALQALAAALEAGSGPVIVAGHYPVVGPRDVDDIASFGARGYIDASAKLLGDLLARHPRVMAYLCGHVHLTSRRMIGRSCVQLTAGGLGPGAAAIRIYEWDGATLTFATLDVEGPTSFWEPGSAQAAADPYFSSGKDDERSGSWPWPASRASFSLEEQRPTSGAPR